MKKNILFLFSAFFLVLFLALLDSCGNSPSPAGPSAPTSTPTPCTGVFGNNTPSGTVSAPGYLLLSPFSTSTSSRTLYNLAVSIASGGTQYELGVYAGGFSPTTLIVETGAQSVTGTGWNRAALTSPVSLAMNTSYWLAVHTNAVFGSATDPGGFGTTNADASVTLSSYGSLPVTFTGSSNMHSAMVCFAPPCPPGIPVLMPNPGPVYCVQGTTCP